MVIPSLAAILVAGMAQPREKTIQRVGSVIFEKHVDHLSGSGVG